MKKEKKQKSFLDKPFYEGGNKALRTFVDANLVYPEKVLKEGIKGTVVIRYTINHKGEVIETKVLSGIGHGCDEAAQSVVKKLKFQVGTYRNIKVLFHKTIKIHFHAKVAKKKVAPPKNPALIPTHKSLNYTVTKSSSTAPETAKPKAKPSYSYTIKIG